MGMMIGEVQSDAVLDLDLVDAGQVILDRVFGRDDLAVRTVQRVQCRVQRRGLAGPRGTGDQEDPIRPTDQALEVR